MNEDVIALSIPIIAIGGSLIFGIIKVLTEHQRKMAAILRETRSDTNSGLIEEVRKLRMEMAELRDRTNLAILEKEDSEPPPVPDLAQRIGQG